MGLQCGRYDTWELNSYWVNEAIAERRCRAPGSCLHCVMAVSMSAVSRADADHDVDGKAGSGRLQQGKDAFVCPIVWIHQNGNVGDLRRQRQVVDAFSQRVVDGASDRGHDRRERRFAEAPRLQLLPQLRHRLCAAAKALMAFSTPTKVLV